MAPRPGAAALAFALAFAVAVPPIITVGTSSGGECASAEGGSVSTAPVAYSTTRITVSRSPLSDCV